MGFGDDEPPAVRAEAFPATLAGPGGFHILVLTFVSFDVIKFTASGGGAERHMEVESGKVSTDFIFQPVKSGAVYTLTAQGCAKAFDGSTSHCSPPSSLVTAVAANNTNSLRAFLKLSGIQIRGGVRLRSLIHTIPPSGLRSVMCV
jgi:hypothetical protein